MSFAEEVFAAVILLTTLTLLILWMDSNEDR